MIVKIIDVKLVVIEPKSILEYETSFVIHFKYPGNVLSLNNIRVYVKLASDLCCVIAESHSTEAKIFMRYCVLKLLIGNRKPSY